MTSIIEKTVGKSFIHSNGLVSTNISWKWAIARNISKISIHWCSQSTSKHKSDNILNFRKTLKFFNVFYHPWNLLFSKILHIFIFTVPNQTWISETNINLTMFLISEKHWSFLMFFIIFEIYCFLIFDTFLYAQCQIRHE